MSYEQYPAYANPGVAYANQDVLYAKAQLNGGYAGDCAVEPPLSLTSGLASKLQTLANVMDDASGHLASLSDRLFGAAPRPVAGANSANKPMGQAAEIGFILDSLIDRARYARDEAAQLNSRI